MWPNKSRCIPKQGLKKYHSTDLWNQQTGLECGRIFYAAAIVATLKYKHISWDGHQMIREPTKQVKPMEKTILTAEIKIGKLSRE